MCDSFLAVHLVKSITKIAGSATMSFELRSRASGVDIGLGHDTSSGLHITHVLRSLVTGRATGRGGARSSACLCFELGMQTSQQATLRPLSFTSCACRALTRLYTSIL